MDTQLSEPVASRQNDPEAEALLADSVGVALLVVLQTLSPAERIAFVLHDLFDLSFDEIAPMVGRSSVAARQLASRARRRVRGGGATVLDADRARQYVVVDAFLAASRGGNFDALLSVLDPDVVLRADRTAVQAGGTEEVRGAASVAALFVGRAQAAKPVLINGAVGIIVAPLGRLFLVLVPTIKNDKIVHIDVVGDPAHLQKLNLSVLGG